MTDTLWDLGNQIKLKLDSGWNDYGYHLLYNCCIDGKDLNNYYRVLILNASNNYITIEEYIRTENNKDVENSFFGSGTFDFYRELASLDNMTKDLFNDKLVQLNDVLSDNKYKELQKIDVPIDSYGDSPVDSGLFRDYDPGDFINFKDNSGANIFTLLRGGYEGASYFCEQMKQDKFKEAFNSWLNKDKEALNYLSGIISFIDEERKKITNPLSPKRTEHENLYSLCLNDKKMTDNLIWLTNNSLNIKNDTQLLQKLASLFGEEEREIVSYISKIESQLKCEDNELKELGQYTPTSTLKFVLPDVQDKDKKIKLRLTNGNQLNDPMEGRLLFEMLKLDNTCGDYNSTNNFLASLTSASDNLPMWKQYGDDAEGVYTVISDVYLEAIKGYLYHTCYIDTKNNGDIKDFEFTINGDDKGDKAKEIKENLCKIGENIEEIKKNDKKNKKLARVIKYMDRISFLFKKRDYSYENEYRVIRNEVDRNNIDVVENNGKYMLYTYILNEHNLSYSKIMIGPNNIENINYIAEYIKLVSPETKVTVSKIQYR